MYLQLFGLTVNLPAQIVGLIGLAVIAASYQFRKVKYLVWSTVAMALFLAESCILSADSDTVTGIVFDILQRYLAIALNCTFHLVLRFHIVSHGPIILFCCVVLILCD